MLAFVAALVSGPIYFLVVASIQDGVSRFGTAPQDIASTILFAVSFGTIIVFVPATLILALYSQLRKRYALYWWQAAFAGACIPGLPLLLFGAAREEVIPWAFIGAMSGLTFWAVLGREFRKAQNPNHSWNDKR